MMVRQPIGPLGRRAGWAGPGQRTEGPKDGRSEGWRGRDGPPEQRGRTARDRDTAARPRAGRDDLTTLEDATVTPVVLGGARGGPDVPTLRKDRYWVQPVVTVTVLTAFVAYATWAAFVNKNYYAGAALHRDLISPFYSPCLTGSCVPGSHPGTVITWWTISPALLILIFPLGFRLTCYYYRKAYYRSFWQAPPACAVSDGHGAYTGETRFPLLLQNVHRYFFYFGLVLQRHPHHRRRPGLPPARRRHRLLGGHRGAARQRHPAVALLPQLPRLPAPVRGRGQAVLPRRPSGTGSGGRSPRSTPGTCCSPG